MKDRTLLSLEDIHEVNGVIPQEVSTRKHPSTVVILWTCSFVTTVTIHWKSRIDFLVGVSFAGFLVLTRANDYIFNS